MGGWVYFFRIKIFSSFFFSVWCETGRGLRCCGFERTKRTEAAGSGIWTWAWWCQMCCGLYVVWMMFIGCVSCFVCACQLCFYSMLILRMLFLLRFFFFCAERAVPEESFAKELKFKVGI